MIGGGEQLSATESITTTGIARQDIRDAQARGQDAIRRMEEAMGIPTANIVPLDFQNRCAVVGRSRYTSCGTDSAAATATTAIGGSATATARGGATSAASGTAAASTAASGTAAAAAAASGAAATTATSCYGC